MNSVYQQSKRKTSSEGASPSLFMWKMCPQKLLKDSDSVEKIRNFDSLLGQNGRSKKLANNYLRLLMCDQPDIAEVLAFSINHGNLDFYAISWIALALLQGSEERSELLEVHAY